MYGTAITDSLLIKSRNLARYSSRHASRENRNVPLEHQVDAAIILQFLQLVRFEEGRDSATTLHDDVQWCNP